MSVLDKQAYLNAMGIKVWQLRNLKDKGLLTTKKTSHKTGPIIQQKDRSETTITIPSRNEYNAHNQRHISNPKDKVVPKFQLYFQLWPCGTLWISDKEISASLNKFQYAVSQYLTEKSLSRLAYAHFKWPYLDASEEDQSFDVALKGLEAQWLYFEQKKILQWIAVGEDVTIWLDHITSSPLMILPSNGWQQADQKKALWNVLKQRGN